MSRLVFDLDDGRVVLAGYDAPFATFYAQVFESRADMPDDPIYVTGYHPAERELVDEPRDGFGSYPHDSVADLAIDLAANGVLLSGHQLSSIDDDARMAY